MECRKRIHTESCNSLISKAQNTLLVRSKTTWFRRAKKPHSDNLVSQALSGSGKLLMKGVTYMITNPTPVFGRPEFAKTIHAEFPKLFEVLPRALAALNDLTRRACENPQPYQRVILNLGLLAGISMVELVTLAGNGLGQGAMKICRTLMETAVNAEYLRLNPGELDDYLNWSWVEKNKELNFIKESLPQLLPIIERETIDKIENKFRAVRHRYEKQNGDLRSSWCRLNFAARSASVGLADLYKMVNPRSSGFIHGTIGGLVNHFNIAEDRDRIAVPPSLAYCSQALPAGHQLLCFAINTLANTFNWEPVHSLASLMDDFKYAWPPPAEAAPAL